MKNNYTTEALNCLQYLATALQDNPALKWVQLGLSILTSVILIGYRLWKWWREAKKDGKIDDKEIEDGLDILSDGLEDINDSLDDKDGKDGDKNG
jgi:uncharacterized membrane protein YukC